jgi:hypothetical protein
LSAQEVTGRTLGRLPFIERDLDHERGQGVGGHDRSIASR